MDTQRLSGGVAFGALLLGVAGIILWSPALVFAAVAGCLLAGAL